MLNLLWKGFLIGILIAMPIGIVGICCIQRALLKGKWHGFFSGVGSSLSDFLYAVITCTGLEIIIHFIEKNRFLLQFFSSFLLLSFGIYTFFKNPSKQIEKIKMGIKANSCLQDFLTIFLLSLSNPFVIFLFIGLFNSFHFILPDTKCIFKVIGLIFILLGNVFWWFIITCLISKLQKVLTTHKLWIINKIIGITIISLSLCTFLSSFLKF